MSSSRNKTMTISAKELKEFKGYFVINEPQTIINLENQIVWGDCLETMKFIPSESIDLIVTDPPYNLNKDFGHGTVKLPEAKFENWCLSWIRECDRLLKSSGSIYICIDWPRSCMVQRLLERFFMIRNRITWKRDKGRGAKSNWKNNMEDIWFATKSDQYTFNLEAVKIKRTVNAPYIDKKGRPKDWFKENGKKFRFTHPSNIWTDLIIPFWSMPENTEHPTQKPTKLVERLILASSNQGDLVFDPFMGSGTTAVVAKQLGRKYLACEIEKRYYILTHKRLT